MQMTKLHRWLVLLNISISIFMATLDGSIVNIALPVMSKELSVSIGSIQWVVTSYLLSISVLLLIWGKISDLYGKKMIFASGFIIFTIGSALCGISSSLGMLVFSRVTQAVGASSMMALSQGIITSTFPPNERGRALGISGATVAIGSLVGPSLGGILVDAAGWKSIFLINIPIGIIGTILTFIIIPSIHEAPTSTRFDFKGSVMFIGFLLLLFLGLLFLQEGGISVGIFTLMFFMSVVILFFFIKYERTHENPLINLKLFETRVFSLGLGSAFLSFTALSSTTLFIPFYLQLFLKYGPLTAGLLISAYPLTTAILSPITGFISDKISYRPLTVTGLAINTVVLFRLSTIGSSTSSLEFIILMIFLGAGVAIFQSPNNSSVMGSVPKEHLGIAGGINALFRNLGLVSGTTLSVLIFSYSTKININSLSDKAGAFNPGSFLTGFRIVLVFAALSCLLATIISLSRTIGAYKEKTCMVSKKPVKE